MIYQSNTTGANFIQGLSRMWRELFSQSAEVETAYKAAELVWSEAILSLLQDMQGTSLLSQRALRRLLFRYDVVEESSMFVVPNALSTGYNYLIPVSVEDKGWKINRINYIGNTLIAPSVFLEKDIDFEMVLEGSDLLETYRQREPNLPDLDYVSFAQNPFENSKFPKRLEDTTFYNVVSPIGAAVDYPTLGIGITHKLKLYFDATGSEYVLPISSVSVSQLEFPPQFIRVMDPVDAARLSLRGFKFEVLDSFGTVVISSARGRFLSNEIRDRAMPLWYADLLVDDYSLSNVYGTLLGVQEASTENYKDMLRGLLQYYVRGISLGRTKSAVHVIAGLPVIDSDGETVSSVSTTGAYTVVTTDKNVYYTETDYPLATDIMLAAGAVDGNVPDGTAKWLLFPKEIDLRSLGVSSSHKIKLYDNTGTAQALTVVKAYNKRLVLVSTAVTAGVGTYYGVSIGTNATAYDNLVPYTSEYGVAVRAFTSTAEAFNALHPITNVVDVTDHVETPGWWENKSIPLAIMETQDISRRRMSTRVFPGKIGTSSMKIGDPVLNVGGDEENRDQGEKGVLIELPYFSKTQPVAKDFRRGDIIASIAGAGNGEAEIQYHDEVRNILYVKVLRGEFFPRDRIVALRARTTAYLGYRTRLEISGGNADVALSSYFITGSGNGSGRVMYRIGAAQIEVYENPGIRLLGNGDTLVINGVSKVASAVDHLPFAKAHRATASYLMDKVWKNGIIHISYDFASFRFPRGLQNLRELVTQGAEGRVFVFIEPLTSFNEIIPPPEETFALSFTRMFSDTYGMFSTLIKIGGPRPGGGVWQISDADYVLGGTNPAYTSANIEGFAGGPAIADLAVVVTLIP